MVQHTSMHDGVWVGIDLGTQSVRTVAVPGAGEVVGQGSHPLTSHRHGSHHEQSPHECWQAVIAACRQVLARLPASSIRGLAVDGTSGTILLIDPQGQPLAPGLMYDDGRASSEVQQVNALGQETWRTLGYRMQASWALPKLLWLLHQHPEFTTGTRLLHQTDFINRCLVGGEVPSDSSSALKTGYDLINDCWPARTFDALNVPERIMPRVVRSGVQIGTVCAAAAQATGLPTGIPVIAGMTDGCAAQIGAGALSVGSWNSVLGTTLVLKGVTRDLLHDPSGVVYSHRSPEDTWLPGGASSTGVGAITKFFPQRNLAELDERAQQREPASVVTYPLVAHGERFPFTAPDAEGFTLGEPVDEVDRYASLLQGVAFIERLCFDYLDLLDAPTSGNLYLTGGGARSRYWCQLRADILQRPVFLPANAEPASGMAILAAALHRPVSEVAAQIVQVREVIEPRAERVECFHAPYTRLITELKHRGWIHSDVATHARKRATG